MFLPVFVVALCSAVYADDDSGRPSVVTAEGEVQGFVSQNGVEKFFGIPFATPPVGELRFEAPVPASNWSGKLNATKLQNSCPQLAMPNFKMYNTPLSEDCLYLNVYRPGEPRSGNLSVMVWFHGGGYTHGTANTYDPSPLVKGGSVVVVTVNYRLSAFGFVYQEGKPSATGIQDQQLALRWVKANIAAFGGNPGRVTIFGESAGSGSCAHHITSPTSKGLFHRVILQSGTLGSSWAAAPIDKANYSAFRLAEQLGCKQDLQIDWDCMKEQPMDEITKNMIGAFGPTSDGQVIAADPIGLSDPLASDDVDALIGFTSSEGFCWFGFSEPKMADLTLNYTDLSYLEDSSNFANYLAVTVGGQMSNFDMENRSLLHLAITYEYLRVAQTPVERLKALDMANSDVHFRHGGVRFAAKLANEGHGNVYFYEFDHKFAVDILGPPAELYHGVGHATDVAAMFDYERDGGGTVDGIFGSATLSSATDDPVRERVVKYWTNFAETGNPGGPFHTYNSDKRNYVHIAAETDEEKEGYLGSYYTFWESYVPKLREFGRFFAFQESR